MKTLLLAIVSMLASIAALAGPVNINTADAAQLSQELNGVGLSKAQAIVDYRNKYGDFESAEELVKVKGIGTRLVAANAKNIRVDD